MNTTESRLLTEDDLPNATPVITLELLSRPDRERHASDPSSKYNETDVARPTLILDSSSGVHFLTEDQASSLFSPKLEPTHTDGEDTDDMALSPARSKHELLEYLIRSDGSVVCKLCGEILQSRTHWYRHKYKFHVAPTASPAPLYKCEQCSVFFKSRKGYIGHLASRHPEGEGNMGETSIGNMLDEPNIKQEPIDAELAIPRCELPNTNYTGAIVTATPNIVANSACNTTLKLEHKKVIRSTKGMEVSGGDAGGVEWEKQRRREERLVADIIARVRRECEASGAAGGARRALKMMAVMQQNEPTLPAEFLVTGRTGRRNAMPDILDPPHAGATTAGLPERLQQLATTDPAEPQPGPSNDHSEATPPEKPMEVQKQTGSNS